MNTSNVSSGGGIKMRQLGHVMALDLRDNLRRPLYWLWALFIAFNGFLMSRGNWFYVSVDSSIGGEVSWVNSEFEVAFAVALIGFLLLVFLVALGGGMPLVRDEQQRVGELLHATPLSTGEYIWGKFLAALISCLAVVGVLFASLLVFNHLLPDAAQPDTYGPLKLGNFLFPILVFMVPMVVFVCGAAFWLGEWSRRAIVVFLLPISAFLFYNQFFWGWFPAGQSHELVTAINWFDPSGFRWLKYNWLVVDRGITFYNQNNIVYDLPFLLSRLAFICGGFLWVAWSQRRFARRLRSTAAPSTAAASRLVAWWRRAGARQAKESPAAPLFTSLTALQMRQRSRSWLSETWTVARFELHELRAQPGLYILLPIVFVFTLNTVTQGRGPFQTMLLATSGNAAIINLMPLALWTGLLLLFYTVESLRREADTRLDSIFLSTPVSSVAVLLGKTLALMTVPLLAMVAALLACWVVMAQQGVTFEPWPFLLVWVLLLGPSLLLWTAMVVLSYQLARSRYGTYGVGIAILGVTGWMFMRGYMNWLTNWPLALPPFWSDISVFELDRRPLWLNRLFALSLTALLAAFAWATFGRRDGDATRDWRVKLASVRRPVLALFAALLLLPAGLAMSIWNGIQAGFDGEPAREERLAYWRDNLATWRDADVPEIRHMDLDIDFHPEDRRVDVAGSYQLINLHDELPWIPITGGVFWSDVEWTWNGQPVTPRNHHGLHVFEPTEPLAMGEVAELGFRYQSRVLPGMSRQGTFAGAAEFVLPSGLVLTGRNPDFLPVVGYIPGIGVDEENQYQPERFAPGAHDGPTESEIDRSNFTAELRITVPEGMRANSMGVLVDDQPIAEGRHLWHWRTDYPVRVVNVIAGRWAEKRGQNTAIFHHPEHDRNVDSMLDALDGAKHFFSEWYAPYPWQELRLSEFPTLTPYARGNPTNILFSEAVGFLTRPDDDSDIAFEITAHEAAHQWWGHIVSNGDAPGGIVMSEGAAHFATLMLLEEMRGPAFRMNFARRIERIYGEFRQPNDEQPLVKTRNHRPADNTVVYDKGGWALWMLMNHMGREAFLAGVQEYFRIYHEGPDLQYSEDGSIVQHDHPVIQDFLATLRPFAAAANEGNNASTDDNAEASADAASADTTAFDAFTKQWFFDIVTPEYHILKAAKSAASGGGWQVNAEVRNGGTGTMPVEIAAVAGRRFLADGTTSPEYQRCSTVVELAAGDTASIQLDCAFEPKRLIVDPDVHVLQLQRNAAAKAL